MKKNKGLDYKEYWEDKIGYDYETEIAIYAYVCRTSKSLIKRQKNIDKRYQFDSYNEWKYHIIESVKNKKIDLNEFRHYLVNQKRRNSPSKGILDTMGAPVMVCLVSIIINAVLQFYTDTNLNLKFLFVNTLSISSKVIVVLVIVFILAIPGVVFFIIWLLVLKGFMKYSDTYKLEESFYEDYIEIIDSVIADNEKK